MIRDNWTFTFTCSQLADAARTKAVWHEGRITFWQKAKAEVMQQVRESGIQVSESIAAESYGKSYNNSPSIGPRVLVDSDMQRRLTECHDKILIHLRLLREYDGWGQVLQASGERQLELNADDFLFFFGASRKADVPGIDESPE